MDRRSRRRPARARSGLASVLLIGLLLVGGVLAGLALFAERKLSHLVLGGLGESFSTRIYSAPFVLREGVASPPERMVERLERLGYARAVGDPARAGEFAWKSPVLDVWLRGFRSPSTTQPAARYLASYDGTAWQIKDASGTVVPELQLEPELVSELSGPQKVRRDPATSEEIPDALKKAVVAAEDKRFYSHFGLDPRGIARALWADARGRPLQGGSTITQQLTKNLFLTPRRTLRRKALEAVLSIYLELRYSKDKIITLYLNHIYLGQDGPVSVAGAKAAARFYFGKELPDLDASECALIAGVVRSPYKYNPFRDPEAARARRDFVLRRMAEEGFLTAEQSRTAMAEPLRVKRSRVEKSEKRDNDYFAAEVVRELLPRYGEETLFTNGLRIDTTMDPLLQHEAQAAVRTARGKKNQAALVALDPHQGRVLALVGGKDFSESQFNRATQAVRQPGSAFKPFVFTAGLRKGITAATILQDQPRKYARVASTTTWDPRNYEGIYFGTATVRRALALSLNSATLDLAERVGLGEVIQTAHDLGLHAELSRELGTVLGASEVQLLDLTAAYAPFANGGQRIEPWLIADVVDAEGEVLEAAHPTSEAALEPAIAYLMTSLLRGVVEQGTARSVSAYGFTRPAGGKTGTTNDGRDAWFIGFTTDLLAGVWFGNDEHKPLKTSGARDAVPIWAAFMKTAAQDWPQKEFERPPGLVDVEIDPDTESRAVSGCPSRVKELFVAGTEPTKDCAVHVGGVRGWFKRIFRRGP